MLQGNNRVDRMIKWFAYLYLIYGGIGSVGSGSDSATDNSSSSSAVVKGKEQNKSGDTSKNASVTATSRVHGVTSSVEVKLGATASTLFTNQVLYFVPEVGHDPLQMMSSAVGRCLLFGYC